MNNFAVLDSESAIKNYLNEKKIPTFTFYFFPRNISS